MSEILARLFTWRLDLRTPFAISHGTYHWRDNVFLCIEWDGVVGFGEAPVVPYYGDTVESIVTDLEATITVDLIRRSLEEPSESDAGFAASASRCAFNTAIVDIKAKRRGEDLATHLGAGHGQSMLSSYTIAYNEAAEAMVENAEGHPCLKVKLGFPEDTAKLRFLRQRRPDAVIRVDANQGWTLDEAFRKVKDLEELGVELIEEPLPTTLGEIEALAASTSIPIALDEHVTTVRDIETCLAQAPSVSGVVVKLAKSGGPQPVLEMINVAKRAGLKVMVSSMVESSLGATAASHLIGLCDWCDIDTPLLISNDPFVGLTYAEHCVVPPNLPGVGAEPTPEIQATIADLSPLVADR